MSSTEKAAGNAGAKGFGLGAGFNIEREMSKKFKIEELSPSRVAELLAETEALFLVDEVDVLRDDSVRKLLAELVKQLSD